MPCHRYILDPHRSTSVSNPLSLFALNAFVQRRTLGACDGCLVQDELPFADVYAHMHNASLARHTPGLVENTC